MPLTVVAAVPLRRPTTRTGRGNDRNRTVGGGPAVPAAANRETNRKRIRPPASGLVIKSCVISTYIRSDRSSPQSGVVMLFDNSVLSTTIADYNLQLRSMHSRRGRSAGRQACDKIQ